jgi:hypothetical protein
MLGIFGTKSRDRNPQWPQSEDPKTKLSRSFQKHFTLEYLASPKNWPKACRLWAWPLYTTWKDMLLLIPSIRNGDGSKPCNPGEHQNS